MQCRGQVNYDRVSFDTASTTSSNIFESLIFPVLQQHLGYTNYYRVESQDNATLQILDYRAGIDYLLEQQDGSLISVANRVQTGNNWKTFTLRKSCRSGQATEYQKRVRDYNNNSLRPALTIQSYVLPNSTGSKILGLGVVGTDHLISTAIQLNKQRQLMSRSVSDGSFYYIPFDRLTLLLEI